MENPHFLSSVNHLFRLGPSIPWQTVNVITRGYMEYMGSIHFGLKICRVNMGSEGMSFIRLPRSEWTTRMDCGDALFTSFYCNFHGKAQEIPGNPYHDQNKSQIGNSNQLLTMSWPQLSVIPQRQIKLGPFCRQKLTGSSPTWHSQGCSWNSCAYQSRR